MNSFWTTPTIPKPPEFVAFQVTGVRRGLFGRGHEAITHLSVEGVLWERELVVRAIEDPSTVHVFYTVGAGGEVALVDVNTGPTGLKFVQTRADGTWTNNLLSLPPC